MASYFIFLSIVALISIAYCRDLEDLTLENCKCNEGYKAQKQENGTIECVGVNVYKTEPCNVKNPPTCKCSGDANGILIDAKGTWCSATPKEVDYPKLWPCENEEDWIAYKKSLEEEKP